MLEVYYNINWNCGWFPYDFKEDVSWTGQWIYVHLSCLLVLANGLSASFMLLVEGSFN